jgi:hypothetical protein
MKSRYFYGRVAIQCDDDKLHELNGNLGISRRFRHECRVEWAAIDETCVEVKEQTGLPGVIKRIGVDNTGSKPMVTHEKKWHKNGLYTKRNHHFHGARLLRTVGLVGLELIRTINIWYPLNKKFYLFIYPPSQWLRMYSVE